MIIVKPEKKRKTGFITTTYTMDETTHKRLELIAKYNGVSRTEVLKQLINTQYLEEIKRIGDSNGN
jgi:hypothetical protein